MLSRLNVLISFGSLKERCTDVLRPDWDVLLDSGAFTNFKAGRDVVTFDQYAAFLEQHGARFWRYMNLDRIGAPAASDANFRRLKELGFSPVPVFQRGAAIAEFLELAKTNDLVALGGIAGGAAMSRTGSPEYVASVMVQAKRTKTSVHLLGIGGYETLSTLRPYSADSSNFAACTRYAKTQFWDARGRCFVNVGRDTKPTRRLVQLLAAYGVKPSDLKDRSWWGRSGVMRAAAWSNFHYIEHLARLGVKYFIAVDGSDLAALTRYWDEYRSYANLHAAS